jgi:hypothetical protein
VGFALGEHVPPSTPDEPPEPPVEPPEPPAVVVLVEPAAPAVAEVEVVPPSLSDAESSLVHAAKIAITADAATHVVMFFIRLLLAIGYFKP